METLDPNQARTYMHKLLSAMKDAGGSDLFIAADFPPSIKTNGQMSALTKQKLPAEIPRQLADAMMNDHQRAEERPENEEGQDVRLQVEGHLLEPLRFHEEDVGNGRGE